jgi:two-component system, response regulator PdtaR
MEGKPPKPRRLALIVEDDPFVRLFGADLLEHAGFDILQACNADEGLRLLETHPEICVVFSDVEMPGSLDGLGLAWHICHRWPGIGIVVTSGHPHYGDAIPPDGRFLAKPYDGPGLLRQIDEVMHQSMQVGLRGCITKIACA